MKKAEEIYEDALNYEYIPDEYGILESNCFLSLKRLLNLYYSNQVSKEYATSEKNKIFRMYELDKAQLENRTDRTNQIQNLKSELRKILLQSNTSECLISALKLIEVYSGERWEYEIRDERLSKGSA